MKVQLVHSCSAHMFSQVLVFEQNIPATHFKTNYGTKSTFKMAKHPVLEWILTIWKYENHWKPVFLWCRRESMDFQHLSKHIQLGLGLCTKPWYSKVRLPNCWRVGFTVASRVGHIWSVAMGSLDNLSRSKTHCFGYLDIWWYIISILYLYITVYISFFYLYLLHVDQIHRFATWPRQLKTPKLGSWASRLASCFWAWQTAGFCRIAALEQLGGSCVQNNVAEVCYLAASASVVSPNL